MKAELIFIPRVTIHPDRICYYQEPHWDPARPGKRKDSEEDTEQVIQFEHLLKSDRKSHGKVSVTARRKMSKAIDYLIMLAKEKQVTEKIYGKSIKFKLAFVTITLPSKQIHPDSEIINKCFNQLLIECKKYYNIKRYVWRAEKQGNGNIHFHLLVDNFIAWNELRDRWNRIINKLGYVDRFKEKHGNKQPNSTDIHSTRKVKNLKKYLAKYMTKDDKKCATAQNDTTEFTKQTGRIWSCSQDLSNITGLKIDLDSESEAELTKIITNSNCRTYKDYYFQVWYVNIKDYIKYDSELLFKRFASYIFEAFSEPISLQLL